MKKMLVLVVLAMLFVGACSPTETPTPKIVVVTATPKPTETPAPTPNADLIAYFGKLEPLMGKMTYVWIDLDDGYISYADAAILFALLRVEVSKIEPPLEAVEIYKETMKGLDYYSTACRHMFAGNYSLFTDHVDKGGECIDRATALVNELTQ